MDSTNIRQLRITNKKISNVYTRAVIKTIRQDGGKIFVQVTAMTNQMREGVELLQQYGFKSKPMPGARGIMLAKGGRINNSSVICADDKRFARTPEFEEGESRQYDDQGGYHRIFDEMHFLQGDLYEFRIDDDNKIEFTAGSLKFTVGGELYEFTSSKLQTTTADVIADTVSLQNHVHLINGGSSSPGPTAPPTP